MTDYYRKTKTELIDMVKKEQKENTVLASNLKDQTELELKNEALECACTEYNRQLQDAKRKNAIRMQLGDYTLLFDGCEIVKNEV